MLAASQDIDSFIERQRSQLNKQPTRQSAYRPPPQQVQPPAPGPAPVPPIQSSFNPTNVQDRLDFKVARILDEPPPRVQPYYPPSSSPPPPPPPQERSGPFYSERQDFRRPSNEMMDENPSAFFNKFGTYEDKRSQLKHDLKREYNEYLQAQKQVPKSKSTSQLVSPRGNPNRRGQGPSNGKVVAPWEKGDGKGSANVQSMQDLTLTTNDYPSNSRSRPQIVRNDDEQYVRDREAYIGELHAQIRELEARKRELEMQSSKLSAGSSSNVTRAHYREDLNALNSLLAERLDQRNAVDMELAHILNRPPVSTSPTRIGSGNMPPMNNMMMAPPPNNAPYPPNNQRSNGPPGNRQDPRARPNDGFQIGHENDKDSEQAAKKRYQQELQAQIREAQMRKAQAKREKDEYDRKMEAEIQRYNYFGRSGGGAPMRDQDGNVVANLADLRNPSTQQTQQQPPPPGHAPFSMPEDKVYSLGNGSSSILNAPFYNGESQQPGHPQNSNRSGSPNHARGAVSNGIFGAAKTEEQFAREEKYKQDLKRQIEEKRQREVEEAARRRAEEERELAKHLEWQQQMERQMAEEAARKQEKETQERLQQQQRQEELERQRQAEEAAARRKPKRVEKPVTPKRETSDDYGARQNTYDEPEQQQPPPATDNAYRSSSPPIPALKNKGKKNKPKAAPVQPPSFDNDNPTDQPTSPPPLPPLTTNDDYMQGKTPTPPADAVRISHGQQTYRKPPTPGQPDVTSARKKPPPAAQVYQSRTRPGSNTGIGGRSNSALSLRSDGSDSEVLTRLEHLKRQLKDKEARLQEHVVRHQAETTSAPQVSEPPKSSYQPPTSRKQSPGFLLNAARMHHRDSPTNNDRARRLLQTDDDLEFRPSYFRDDTILMNGAEAGPIGQEYYPSKRIDSADRLFGTKIEREANQRKYGYGSNNYYDQDDPTAMANYELNRIAEQNEQRLKKLRDLEHDDASLLDSNEVLERFQQRQRLQRGGSQTTLQDDAWLK